MTTRDPGASVVLTHGLGRSPRSTAFFASRPAASMTWGLEVLVQLVMAATTTAPSSTSTPVPSTRVAGADRLSRPNAVAKAPFDPLRDTRSWGRDGPAMDGTTVDRSSSMVSENTGSGPSVRWKSPCSRA